MLLLEILLGLLLVLAVARYRPKTVSTKHLFHSISPEKHLTKTIAFEISVRNKYGSTVSAPSAMSARKKYRNIIGSLDLATEVEQGSPAGTYSIALYIIPRTGSLARVPGKVPQQGFAWLHFKRFKGPHNHPGRPYNNL